MAGRVLVTGSGIISAIGVGVDATLESLLAGKSGIGKVAHTATEHAEFPVGEVHLSNAEMARMAEVSSPADSLRTVLMGIIAAREAVKSAGLTDKEMARAAFISGTTVGGMDRTERHFKEVFDSNGEAGKLLALKDNDCGDSTELIAAHTGPFAMVTTTSTACSSAANAIITGANMIKAGIADIVVAGGSEALTRFHLNGFNSLMILDRGQCRPFDRDRNGINLGEGAAYIVLESEKSATERGAGILGQLSGYGNACDAFHQTASSADGEGAYLAMRKALEMAGLQPDEISYVNAHGTGTPNNDETELTAMSRIWGEALPPFSSTKAFTGHTTSASGSIEAVISLLALRRGFIPANLGWQNPIKEGAAPVTDTKTGTDLTHIVDNSFGFGGNDSSLIFSKYQKHG